MPKFKVFNMAGEAIGILDAEIKPTEDKPCGVCDARTPIAGIKRGDYVMDITLDPAYRSLDVHAFMEQCAETILDFSISIDYCPKCGRKLKGGNKND